MSAKWASFEPGKVKLEAGLFQQRSELNRAYLLSLKPDNLLQNHYLEAGIGNFRQIRNTSMGDTSNGDDRHWGWESPTCQLRGHFLGHWLSAVSRAYASTGDLQLKLRADEIVQELARCQSENGGEWVFSIPEKYLERIAAGKQPGPLTTPFTKP
ncbi:MAG TPA: beta-L-arabinofuranosidase domain-containing protein [Chloroflexia bacterium]|nr:beta-L-arabinofuranosidase domain-containing protein [Chloroflexia bacterium]